MLNTLLSLLNKLSTLFSLLNTLLLLPATLFLLLFAARHSVTTTGKLTSAHREVESAIMEKL